MRLTASAIMNQFALALTNDKKKLYLQLRKGVAHTSTKITTHM
jgi:hypothetical protein